MLSLFIQWFTELGLLSPFGYCEEFFARSWTSGRSLCWDLTYWWSKWNLHFHCLSRRHRAVVGGMCSLYKREIAFSAVATELKERLWKQYTLNLKPGSAPYSSGRLFQPAYALASLCVILRIEHYLFTELGLRELNMEVPITTVSITQLGALYGSSLLLFLFSLSILFIIHGMIIGSQMWAYTYENRLFANYKC